jgi:hypothetical protein
MVGDGKDHVILAMLKDFSRRTINHAYADVAGAGIVHSFGGCIRDAIEPGAQGGADARHAADTALATWRAVEAALAPIVGRRGVAALYKRSLYLTRSSHSCLLAVYESADAAADFIALHAALAQQTGAAASGASAALLETFHSLLANLIGASLTDQLLRSVWDDTSGGNAAQDPLK